MIHVSIHDVSPAWEREVDEALALCAEVGSKPGLLVVPDMHHRAPLGRHPEYCARLRALAVAGHEVFLHGYYHLAAEPRGRGGRGVGWFVAQRVVSAGEAEFAALDEREGEALLAQGIDDLRAQALPLHGFVPPAWARRRWLLGALARRGIAFTEDQLFVYQPVTGARRFCPALNYASRTRGRRVSSVAYARLGRLYPRAGLPVRIAIHPADLRHPWLVRETRALLAWAAGRTTDRAADLFA